MKFKNTIYKIKNKKQKKNHILIKKTSKYQKNQKYKNNYNNIIKVKIKKNL